MVSKILLIRLRELGDTILMSPLVRHVRRLHSTAEIDVLCQSGNRSVLEHHPDISRLIVLPPKASPGVFLGIAKDLRRRRYDTVIDVQGLPKTALMARLTNARQRIGFINTGWRNRACYTHPRPAPIAEYAARGNLRLLEDDPYALDDIGLDFHVGDEAEAAADEFCRRYLRPPVAAIFGICRFQRRGWPKEKTAEVADRLAALGIQPWLVYGPGQAEHAGEIADSMRSPAVHGYDMPSFATLRAILARCTLFFGNDGGPKHAAVAAGIPTVTIYKADAASVWAPPGTRQHRVVCTRSNHRPTQLEGIFTDADTIAEIPVSAAWQQISIALRQSVYGQQPMGYPTLRAA